MKKIIILTAVTTVLLVGGQQKAWAGKKANHEDDEYRTFRKIVHILDDLINDDYRRGKPRVYVRRYVFPRRRVCYYKGPYEVCRLNPPKHYPRGHKRHHKYKHQSWR